MDIAATIQDSAPFSFLAVLCVMTSPIWVACAVSLFVPSRFFRLGTGITTAFAGLFIVAMGVTAFVVHSNRASAASQHADPSQAAEIERRGRQEGMNALQLLSPIGVLPLVLGSVATALGARTPRSEKK